jgi:CRP-like cAMP-binding protein
VARKGELLIPTMLRGLPDDVQAQLRSVGYSAAFRKGETLLHAGQLASEVYFVRSGWFAFQVAGAVSALHGAGEPILVGLGRAHPRSVGDLVALTTGSVAVIERVALRTQLLRHPEVLLAILNHKLVTLTRTRLLYARRNTDPLEVRLAYLLWTLAELLPDGHRRIPSDISQAPLASLLGVPREEVSRKRNLLVKTGYLFERDGDWFIDPSTPLLLTSTGYDLSY